jgi:hypothetical protein
MRGRKPRCTWCGRACQCVWGRPKDEPWQSRASRHVYGVVSEPRCYRCMGKPVTWVELRRTLEWMSDRVHEWRRLTGDNSFERVAGQVLGQLRERGQR